MLEYQPSNTISLTEHFHRIIRMIPEEQELATVSPGTTVKAALHLMKERNYSQLPVVAGSRVIGVFSYRSFSRAIAKLDKLNIPVEALAIDEFIERCVHVRTTDELTDILDQLDRDGSVLVGDPDRLLAIITSIDALRFFYDVASPFVMVAEMELAIRALIQHSVTDDVFAICISNSLSERYKEGKCPKTLQDMDFSDYVSLVGDGRNWVNFQSAFGGSRDRTRARLDRIRTMRNDIFHQKHAICVEEYEELVSHRNWLLMRTELTEALAGDNA